MGARVTAVEGVRGQRRRVRRGDRPAGLDARDRAPGRHFGGTGGPRDRAGRTAGGRSTALWSSRARSGCRPVERRTGSRHAGHIPTLDVALRVNADSERYLGHNCALGDGVPSSADLRPRSVHRTSCAAVGSIHPNRPDAKDLLVNPLRPRPETPSSEDIAKLLMTARVQRGGKGDTLTTASVVVARGKHRGDFQLFDGRGTPIGVAVAERRCSYEIRDPEDRCVLSLHEVGINWEVLGYRNWRYEVVLTDDSGPFELQDHTGATDSARSHSQRQALSQTCGRRRRNTRRNLRPATSPRTRSGPGSGPRTCPVWRHRLSRQVRIRR